MSSILSLGEKLKHRLLKVTNRLDAAFRAEMPDSASTGSRRFYSGHEYMKSDAGWERVYKCPHCQDEYYYTWLNPPGIKRSVYPSGRAVKCWCLRGDKMAGASIVSVARTHNGARFKRVRDGVHEQEYELKPYDLVTGLKPVKPPQEVYF